MKRNIQKSLLPKVELIASSARKSRGLFAPDSRTDTALNELTAFFEITPEQAWLFSVIIDVSLKQKATIDSIAEYLKCSAIRVIDLTDELNALEETQLIQKQTAFLRRSDHNEFHYFIPQRVIESLRTGDQIGRASCRERV